MSPSTSTRWSPTPEQLMILEEMYKGGLRTPNASQIQKITAHLSFYGKIEGKNVFYWFQNHKARDRQKLRKKLSKQLQQQQQQLLHDQLLLQQYQTPQNYNTSTSNVLSLIDPPSHHLLHDSPAEYLRHDQGGADGATARMTNNYGWKMDQNQENLQESAENCVIRSLGDDWMMMMMMSMKRDEGPTNSTLPCCRNRPLKTLELFPINAPSVEEDQIQGTTSKPNNISSSSSSSTSLNN